MDEILDGYLSMLNITLPTKRIHRKAISDILALLSVRGRKIPLEDDYDDYCYYLLKQGKSIENQKYAMSCIRKFFAWLAENPNYTGHKEPHTTPTQSPRKKRARRVSILLPPAMYDSLEKLAECYSMDIPTVINDIVAKYITACKDKIDSLKA